MQMFAKEGKILKKFTNNDNLDGATDPPLSVTVSPS